MKLVDCWRDLEPGLQHGLHPLQPDVLGPFDEAAQVPLGLDVLANTKVLRPLLKKRVLLSLLFESGALGRRCGHSLTFSYHVCSNYLKQRNIQRYSKFQLFLPTMSVLPILIRFGD